MGPRVEPKVNKWILCDQAYYEGLIKETSALIVITKRRRNRQTEPIQKKLWRTGPRLEVRSRLRNLPHWLARRKSGSSTSRSKVNKPMPINPVPTRTARE